MVIWTVWTNPCFFVTHRHSSTRRLLSKDFLRKSPLSGVFLCFFQHCSQSSAILEKTKKFLRIKKKIFVSPYLRKAPYRRYPSKIFTYRESVSPYLAIARYRWYPSDSRYFFHALTKNSFTRASIPMCHKETRIDQATLDRLWDTKYFILFLFSIMATPTTANVSTSPEFTRSHISIPNGAIQVMTPEQVRQLITESANDDPIRASDNPEFQSYTLEWEENPILYGIELEFHLLASTRTFTRALPAFQRKFNINFFTIKNDGSLTNGYEIVTHPFSRKWFYAHQWIFQNLLTLVYECGWKINANAGLHIHISRQGITNKTKAKLFYFINERSNREIVQQISGRSASQYAKFYEAIPLLTDEWMEIMEQRSEKYEAVNWKHDNTIEIRIFKSTTTTAKLFWRLEFLFSLFEFFKVFKATKELTANNYKNFIMNNQKFRFLKWLIEIDSEL